MRYAMSACDFEELPRESESDAVLVRFTGACVATGVEYAVTVPEKGVASYAAGALMQDAFPDVPRGDREFLMSGMSPQGWIQVFGNPDGEEADAGGDDDLE